MRVMVTGGTGFIATNLVRGLVAEDHEVVAYDLVPTMARFSNIGDKATLVRGDICDLIQLFETIKNYKIDHIMHLAAYLPEATIRENPTKSIRINLEGTNNVFEAAKIMGVERVVYASTDAVNPIGSKEDAPCKPTTLYGYTKLFNEAMGIHFYNQFGLDTIGLRFGMNYGPGGRLLAGEQERKYGSAVALGAIEKVALGEPVTIPFHKSTSFHCVYTRDNVRAMTLALKTGKTKNRVFNVCGEDVYTLGDMANILKKIVPTAIVKFVNTTMPSSIRTSEALKMDCSAAREELGYAPEYTLEQGLREYIETVRKNPSLYRF